MSGDGSTFHQQHHVKQDAPLPESQQAVQEAPEVGRTPVALPVLATRRAGAGARASASSSSSSFRTRLAALRRGPVLVFGLHGRRRVRGVHHMTRGLKRQRLAPPFGPVTGHRQRRFKTRETTTLKESVNVS